MAASSPTTRCTIFDAVIRHAARPFVGLWLNFSRHSWQRHVVAHDSPHVRAPGTNPDRVLVVGDGAATGRGVLTHDLGLPGFLARSLSARTGRATDVDIAVGDDMTAHDCVAAVATRDLDTYDVIVLSVGANEALALMAPREWQTSIRSLLEHVYSQSASATKVFVLEIPQFGINPHFPRILAGIVDRNAIALNRSTRAALGDFPEAIGVPESRRHVFEFEGAHQYHQWAETIATRISAHLDPARPQASSTAFADESLRQRSLEDLESRSNGPDTVLDALTEQARQMFGTSIAAVTFIRSDTQLIRSSQGMEPVILPRDESFCDVTIRRSSHLVIEDASVDSRYADFSVVAGGLGIRFYAGYPIEAPNGQRIGALCVMDTAPRHFTVSDASILRTLAFGIQKHLYRDDTDPVADGAVTG